jgi:hypothetical protein
MDQQGRRLDVTVVAADLVGAEPGVGGRADHARLGAGEEELDVLGTVRGEESKSVTLCQSEVEQGPGEPVGALV